MNDSQPVEIRHEKGARRVVVDWDDGHVSPFPLDYLRSWCPCAGCQGHDPVAKYLSLTGQELLQLDLVGNYAVAPTWQDGHNTGLYSFRLLRRLCPCEACGGEKR
ncbi:MAG: gamma-butyrobetaine hydroxylase-like domain-containing protein [Vicinamibacteria bacterium]